jgi:hypothetical protein
VGEDVLRFGPFLVCNGNGNGMADKMVSHANSACRKSGIFKMQMQEAAVCRGDLYVNSFNVVFIRCARWQFPVKFKEEFIAESNS